MADKPEFTVMEFGSELESTPESFYAMESIRRAENERRAALDPISRQLEDDFQRSLDHAIFFGSDA